MLAKTFSKGKGAYSGACIDYLADGKDKENPEATAEYDKQGNRLVTREGATLLSGDLELTQELINQASAKFKHGYTAGVLSFEEQDIPMSQKIEIMESFEEAIMPGMDKNEYDIAWIEHTDKNRLELNWVIPRVHLATSAHLQPYFHDVDSHRIKHWQEAKNAKYGYSSPDEPIRRHSLTFRANETPDRKKIKSAIESLLDEANPKNREEVVAELTAVEGLEVVREVKKSISVKVEGQEKNIRLTGVYFEQDFNSDRETTERIREEQSRFTGEAKNRYEYHHREYRSRLQKASARNREKYDRIAGNISKLNQKEQEDTNVAERANTVPNVRSNGFNSHERGSVHTAGETTARTRLHGQTNQRDLSGKQETDRRLLKKNNKSTTEKIASIFNDKRKNDKADNRGRNQTYAEYAAVSTRANRVSTKDNRSYAESLRQTIGDISKKAGAWADKRYQTMKKIITKGQEEKKEFTSRRNSGKGFER